MKYEKKSPREFPPLTNEAIERLEDVEERKIESFNDRVKAAKNNKRDEKK